MNYVKTGFYYLKETYEYLNGGMTNRHKIQFMIIQHIITKKKLLKNIFLMQRHL